MKLNEIKGGNRMTHYIYNAKAIKRLEAKGGKVSDKVINGVVNYVTKQVEYKNNIIILLKKQF